MDLRSSKHSSPGSEKVRTSRLTKSLSDDATPICSGLHGGHWDKIFLAAARVMESTLISPRLQLFIQLAIAGMAR